MRRGPSDASDTPAPTPEQVRTATFGQSQLAWRGYSEDEVRAFLNLVADSMTAADRERVALRQEINRLRNYYRDHGQDVDRLPSGSAGRQRRSSEDGDLLQRIQAYAEVQVERAKEYAALVASNSEDQADAAFHHASVQAALAAEEAIQWAATGTHGQLSLGAAESDRASLWLRAFHHAVYAQMRVTIDTLMKAAHQPVAQARIRPH